MASRYLNHRPHRSPQRHPHTLIIDPHMHPATRGHRRVHRPPLAVDQGYDTGAQVLGGDGVDCQRTLAKAACGSTAGRTRGSTRPTVSFSQSIVSTLRA